MKTWLLAVVLLFSTLALSAQSGRELTFLEVIPDTRAVAMGLQPALSGSQHHLYLNPASLFARDQTGSVASYILMYPKSDLQEGRLWYGALSGGFRFDERHALFAGFRYQGGLKIPMPSEVENAPEEVVKPYDFSLDVGYALQIAKGFSAFATGSFVRSKVLESGNAARFDVGASYHTTLHWGAEPSLLNVVAKVANIGSRLSYSRESVVSLPANVVLASDLHLPVARNHDVAFAVGGRYFLTGTSSEALQLGAGLEYTLYNRLSIRGGYRYAPKGWGMYTLGLGFQYAGFHLDLSYITGVQKSKPDYLLGTLSYTF